MKFNSTIIVFFILFSLITCKEKNEYFTIPVAYNKSDILTTHLQENLNQTFKLNKIRLHNKDTTFYVSNNTLQNAEVRIHFDEINKIYIIEGLDTLSGKYSLWHMNKNRVTFNSMLYKKLDNHKQYLYYTTVFIDLVK